MGTITGNFLTLMQTKISTQGNTVQRGVGQGCEVGASVGHGRGFGVNWGDCCVPAEAGIGLEDVSTKMHMIFCPASMLSSRAVLHRWALLPHLLLLKKHRVSGACPHWEDGLQQDLLLMTVTKDGRSTAGQNHPAVFSWKCLFLENAMC